MPDFLEGQMPLRIKILEPEEGDLSDGAVLLQRDIYDLVVFSTRQGATVLCRTPQVLRELWSAFPRRTRVLNPYVGFGHVNVARIVWNPDTATEVLVVLTPLLARILGHQL